MFIISLLVSNVLLFLWFLYAMWVLRRKHQIREKTGLFYYIILFLAAIGYPGDVLFNIIWGSIILLDVPRLWKGEFTLSLRLERIHKTGRGWRLRIASWVCEKLLDPYDPDGDHC